VTSKAKTQLFAFYFHFYKFFVVPKKKPMGSGECYKSVTMFAMNWGIHQGTDFSLYPPNLLSKNTVQAWKQQKSYNVYTYSCGCMVQKQMQTSWVFTQQVTIFQSWTTDF